jgi:Thioesterase-like superfamily
MAETQPSLPSLSRALIADDLGDGRFSLELDDAWSVGGKPNGGYLACCLAAAARRVVLEGSGHEHCVAMATSFVGSPDAARAEIVITVLRRGLGATQVRAELQQGGGTKVESLCTFASLPEVESRPYDALPPAEVAPFGSCTPIEPRPGASIVVRVHEGAEVRLDPERAGFLSDQPSGVCDLRGWVRLRDGEEPSAATMPFFLDCFPPATFELERSGWVPTVQLTTYLRALPAPGPLRVRQVANVIENGFVDERCEAWDSRGVLVGQAVQLAKVRLS